MRKEGVGKENAKKGVRNGEGRKGERRKGVWKNMDVFKGKKTSDSQDCIT